jgi:hypothetical protein
MTVRSGRCRRDWDGWPYRPLSVWSLIFCASTFAKAESRAAKALSQATVSYGSGLWDTPN